MKKLIFLMLMFFSANIWAASDVVLVSSVKGAVTLEGKGSNTALEPFLRLKVGDRLKLAANAQVSLVYFEKGRQEIWPGTAVLVIGDSESQKLSGNAQVQFKQLPEKVTKQINRTTPTPDGKVGAVTLRDVKDSKVGAVRLRSNPMADLENTYRKLRGEAAAKDVSPELYLLATLYEMEEYERLESEMERICAAFPDDESLKKLRKLYSSAIAAAGK